MYHSYINMSNFSLEAWCLFLCKGSWILLILWTSEVLPSGRALKSEFEHVVWMWTPPSYIHLGSTWRHSCSKCSRPHIFPLCRDDEKQSIVDLEESKSMVEYGCELVVSQSVMERAKYHAHNFRLQDIYNEMVLWDDLMLYWLKENVPSLCKDGEKGCKHALWV